MKQVVSGEAARELACSPHPQIAAHAILCVNSLNAASISDAGGLRTNDAAVAYIARRQTKAWGYIRA